MSEGEVVFTNRKLRKQTRQALGIFKRGCGLPSDPVKLSEPSGTPQLPRSSNMADKTPGLKCNLEGKFPDLVLLDRNNGKVERGLLMLKRNFCLSPYGPLSIIAGHFDGFYRFEILWKDETLVIGEGMERSEAEYNACFTLVKELRKTNYYIEFKKEYWPGYKVWPEFILNPESSMRQIYRVVCLKNESYSRFPFPLSGAVDFVFSEEELWQYVEDHGFSKSNADLFILNIEKPKHKIIKQICAKTDMVSKHLLGCSNLGIHTSRKEDPVRIKKELETCGGENVKYRLLPPGTEVESMALDDVGSDGENQDVGPARKQLKLEEIEISQWIVDYLILMDILDERSFSVSPKEIIFQCVRDCPELEEFIIEKTYDKIGLVKAEALIDRKLVGRAQAFKTHDVKKLAAENALENLRKCCKYIEIKQSYSGIGLADPEFFIGKDPGYKDEICWIANRLDLTNTTYDENLNQLLKLFKQAHVEDLFFLKDFEEEERMEIYELAKEMGLSVRKFGAQYVCVYKQKRPKEVYKQLMLKEVTENDKYRLILPKPKNTVETITEAETPYENLFDQAQEDEEEEDDKQWKNQRKNNRNEGRNNRNQGRNNKGQNRKGNRNNRNDNKRRENRDSRSRDGSSSKSESAINPWMEFGDRNPSRSDNGASRYDAGASRNDTGASRYDTGASRYDTGASRYNTGASRYESGASRYDTAANRYGSGPSRYESSVSRYETGASRYDSVSRYETSANRYGSDSRHNSYASGPVDFYANSNVKVYDYQNQNRSSQQSSDSSLFTRRRD